MNMSGQLSDYWTISTKLINELRIGFMGEHDVFHPATIGQGYPAKLGLKFSKEDIFPMSPSATITALARVPPRIPCYKENTFDISDQVTLIHGRHLLHFGGGALILPRADSTAWGNIKVAEVGFTGAYRGQQHRRARLRFRLFLCGLPVGLCAELERSQFA